MRAIYFLLFCVLSLYAGGQNPPRLEYEAKMRKNSSPISEVICVVPASARLTFLSFEGGYYKVEYLGQVGYISEFYFKKESASGTGSSSSASGRSSSSNQRWDEQSLKNHWRNNGIDIIEGIYEAVGSANSPSRYKIGFLKTTSGYNLIYLSGAPRENAHRWSVGDIKATLSPTATPSLFRPKWYMADKTISENLYIIVDQGYFKTISSDVRLEDMYIKLFPTASDQINRVPGSSSNEPRVGSGTGFALTSTGLIVTNFHVINGANKIKVSGINNNFSITYNARVLVSDRNNDLALLQIDDHRFSSLPPIPFQFKDNHAEVGENVFVLGYPLRRSMGDEIKLTNGIISSRSGFQGDITSYQISAPAQPGNSGGPLFDSQGFLIGVISAKHSAAENATYAVKISYLKSLIGSLGSPPGFSRTNQLNDLPLTKQVEILKKFVFIIETE